MIILPYSSNFTLYFVDDYGKLVWSYFLFFELLVFNFFFSVKFAVYVVFLSVSGLHSGRI